MNDWVDLEHHLWAELKNNSLLRDSPPDKILVALSGGSDSMALLWALWRTRPGAVLACFVHHGDQQNRAHRDEAAHFCHQFCESQGIPFYLRKHAGPALNSEEQLREHRYEILRDLQAQVGACCIAVGHHSEDLLETRLLRLIRGTGPQGLEAMAALKGNLFRPFLSKSKQDLRDYLQRFHVPHLEDPTNQDQEPLRNWLRQTWLPALEDRQKGGVLAMARSLERVVEALAPSPWPVGLWLEEGLSRPHFLSLSRAQQRQALAEFLLKQKGLSFTHAQLEEVLKRLEAPQNEIQFQVGRIFWRINAQQIRVQETE